MIPITLQEEVRPLWIESALLFPKELPPRSQQLLFLERIRFRHGIHSIAMVNFTQATNMTRHIKPLICRPDINLADDLV